MHRLCRARVGRSSPGYVQYVKKILYFVLEENLESGGGQNQKHRETNFAKPAHAADCRAKGA
jgi:hypothetical protein